MVSISLSKHTRKDFQTVIAFGLSAIITSQLMFVPTNMVLKRYLVCQTFSKCQPYSNESCLSTHTYSCKIEADNQLHNCLCGALSIKDPSKIFSTWKRKSRIIFIWLNVSRFIHCSMQIHPIFYDLALLEGEPAVPWFQKRIFWRFQRGRSAPDINTPCFG